MEILTKIKKAVELAKNAEFDSAEKIYDELIKTNPNDFRTNSFLGWLYINQNRFEDALRIFEQMPSSETNPNVVAGLAICYYELGRFEEAYPYLKLSVDKNPTLDTLYKLINCAAENTNQVDTVFNYAKTMQELYPNSPKTWDCYVLAALCAGKFEIAEKYCNNLLEQYPNHPILLLNKGFIKEIVYLDYKSALAEYQKAYEQTQSLPVLYSLGLIHKRLGDFEVAEKYLLRALDENPNAVEIHRSLYLLYAGNKDFVKAYCHFEKSVANLLNTLKNNWHGETSESETLYVYADQGLGDIIMYSRYFQFVVKKFKEVIVALPAVLISLFEKAYSDLNIKFVESSEIVEYDKSTILTLLPYYLDLNYEKIPFSGSYINLPALNTNKTEKLKIGIAWEAGGTKLRGSLDRTINPKLLAPLFEIKNVEFYSLQLDSTFNIKELYPQVEDLSSGLKSFLDTAIVINGLDVVVTVDTSVAHLSGAMGKKTLLMLPEYCDWRWFGGDKSTTEWYDSVEVFKQPAPMDWITVISNVSQKINFLAGVQR